VAVFSSVRCCDWRFLLRGIVVPEQGAALALGYRGGTTVAIPPSGKCHLLDDNMLSAKSVDLSQKMAGFPGGLSSIR
jgi:hypothetical protein